MGDILSYFCPELNGCNWVREHKHCSWFWNWILIRPQGYYMPHFTHQQEHIPIWKSGKVFSKELHCNFVAFCLYARLLPPLSPKLILFCCYFDKVLLFKFQYHLAIKFNHIPRLWTCWLLSVDYIYIYVDKVFVFRSFLKYILAPFFFRHMWMYSGYVTFILPAWRLLEDNFNSLKTWVILERFIC